MLPERGQPLEERLRHDLAALEVRDGVRARREEAETALAVEVEAVSQTVVRRRAQPAGLGQVLRLQPAEAAQRVEHELGLEGAVVLRPRRRPVAPAARAAAREGADVGIRAAGFPGLEDRFGAPPDQPRRRLVHAEPHAVARQRARDERDDAVHAREGFAAGHDALDDGLEGVARADLSHGGASGPEDPEVAAPRGA